jgi:hypothetical protein
MKQPIIVDELEKAYVPGQFFLRNATASFPTQLAPSAFLSQASYNLGLTLMPGDNIDLVAFLRHYIISVRTIIGAF